MKNIIRKIAFIISIVCCVALHSQSKIDSVVFELGKKEKSCDNLEEYLPIIQQMSSINVEKAFFLTDDVITSAKELNCDHTIANFYLCKAILNSMLNKNNEAIVYCDSAIGVYIKVGDDKNLMKAFINRSNYNRVKGDLKAALSDSYIVLKLSEKVNDTLSIASAYSGMAAIYTMLYEYEQALFLVQQSKKLYQTLGAEANLATDMINASKLYEYQKKYDLSTLEIDSAIQIFEKINSAIGLAKAYRQKGDILTEQNQFSEALNYLNYSYEQAIANRDFSLWIEVLNSLQHTYFEMGNFDKSIQYASMLFEQAEQNALNVQKMNALNILYESHKKAKNYEKALFYHEKYRKIKDEIQGEKVQNEINRLKEEFEVEKKERLLSEAMQQQLLLETKIERNTALIFGILGIALIATLSGFLYFRQYKLTQQKQKIELKHQALRAQMNPHFIFNALNSIQRMYVEGNIEKANDFMADFAQLMRKVLEESDKNNIPLQEEIETLKLYLDLEQLRSKNSFSYRIDLDEEINSNYFLIPPLIIQPFLENAIWHGILPLENRKGEILISFTQLENGSVKVVIEDNGVGFDLNKMQAKQQSKGIKITEQRIGQKVAIMSKVNIGTTVEFILNENV